MTHERNKYVFIFLILVFIGGVAWYAASKSAGPQPLDNTVGTSDTIPTVSAIPTSGKYCFTRTQDATADAPYNVEEHVVLNFDGTKITGTKRGTQSGPDMTNGYVGTLKGAAILDSATNKNEMELTYDYVVEGSENRELEDYTIEGKNLVKNRWALHDAKINGQSILVPDYAGDPALITYAPEDCANENTTTIPTEPSKPVSSGKCYVGGCSSQICSDQPGAISTCIYNSEYACYKGATCERQASGQCGWTETPELSACINSAKNNPNGSPQAAQ